MTRRLLGKISKRQVDFIGHMLRKKEMECPHLTGKTDGKKNRGMPRQMYLQSIAQRFRDLVHSADHAANDCAKWTTMAANVRNGHGIL